MNGKPPTFIPPQPNSAESVYEGGVWDGLTDMMVGGRWVAPGYGGLCASTDTKSAAVVGPHLHWNGAYDMACPLGVYCPAPSCHPASWEDEAHTREREIREQQWAIKDQAARVWVAWAERLWTLSQTEQEGE